MNATLPHICNMIYQLIHNICQSIILYKYVYVCIVIDMPVNVGHFGTLCILFIHFLLLIVTSLSVESSSVSLFLLDIACPKVTGAVAFFAVCLATRWKVFTFDFHICLTTASALTVALCRVVLRLLKMFGNTRAATWEVRRFICPLPSD